MVKDEIGEETVEEMTLIITTDSDDDRGRRLNRRGRQTNN